MKVMWKAACAAVLLIAATTIEIGCGDTYRPVATPKPSSTGNPSGAETEAVISCCLDPSSINAVTAKPSSVLTAIDVSGATNSGNKVLGNIVGAGDGTVAVGAAENPISFDGTRTSIFTANTAADSVTQSLLNTTSGGFSGSTNTLSLEPGSHPIAVSFQYYGPTYTQDYVVNSGTGTATCPGTGSLAVISESATQVKSTVCIGTAAVPANPVAAWIFRDQSKVFVLDNTAAGGSNPSGVGHVYVVSASKYKVTNSFAVGKGPIKMAQSADGNYIYTLNSGDGTISVIDAVAETVVRTVSTSNALSSALPIDIAMDPNYTDTSANTQYNHVWILQADGTVSVYDNSSPGTLNYVTALSTGPNPTNLALLRDGTVAYVGLAGTDKIVAINTAVLSSGGSTTLNATTVITVGVHRSVSLAPYVFTPDCVVTVANPVCVTPPTYSGTMSETTTPTVTYVAVSRLGNSSATGDSSDLAKAYAITTTSTIYTYFDSTGTVPVAPTSIPTWTMPTTCTVPSNTTNAISCPNLYSGTAVVAAAATGTRPINTYITTIPAPAQVTYCNPETTLPDGPKACPLMTPIVLLGRS